MSNVRRPKYFNERDRRLIGDEESRLLAAAQAEDRRRCIELALDALVEQRSNADGEYSMLSATTKKRSRLQLRQPVAQQLAPECEDGTSKAEFELFQRGPA